MSDPDPTRLSRWLCCHRPRSRNCNEKQHINLPRGSSPRRIMAASKGREIDISPQDERVDIASLRARMDKKVAYSLLSKTALSGNNARITDCQLQTVIDSGGRAYQCYGFMPATWRLTGEHISVADDFYITADELPDDLDVLLSPSKRNKSAMQQGPKGPGFHPIFRDRKNKHLDLQQQKEVSDRQEAEENDEFKELLKNAPSSQAPTSKQSDPQKKK